MSHVKIRATSAQRRESEAWLDNYADSVQVARRRREMPAKLAKLGLTARQSDNVVLDLCCGHGEALDCLYGLGFRQLHGIDITLTESLANDPRFKTYQGDVLNTGLPAESYDWLMCVHSMHHFASAENVRCFLDESWRLLRPGGRLSIIDFPASFQVKLAFFLFRQRRLLVTPYLRYFGQIIQEEWCFLKDYLPQWPEVRRHIWQGRFEVERESNSLFYFYITLRKPGPISLPV